MKPVAISQMSGGWWAEECETMVQILAWTKVVIYQILLPYQALVVYLGSGNTKKDIALVTKDYTY